MKKNLVAVLIFLYMFAVSVTGYAQLYKTKSTEEKNPTTEQNSTVGNISEIGIYGHPDTSTSLSENANSGGIFRADATGPGGRPDVGEGIGEEAPLKDGINVLVLCSIAFVVVKVTKEIGKRK